MEPKEWLSTGLEDDAGAGMAPTMGLERRGGSAGSRRFRGFDVELRRKPGEGFGFVIASQDVENSKGERSCGSARFSCRTGGTSGLEPSLKSSRQSGKLSLRQKTLWTMIGYVINQYSDCI